MENVVLVIHLILALGIIGLVLIQRSEGGGLGIGGGGGGLGGFSTPKGTANALTRLTAIFAFCFFATSLTLAILAGHHGGDKGILEQYQTKAEATIEERKDMVPVTEKEGAAVEGKTQPQAASEKNNNEGGETLNSEKKPDTEDTSQKPSVPIGD